MIWKGYKSKRNEAAIPAVFAKCECWNTDVSEHKVFHQKIHELKQLQPQAKDTDKMKIQSYTFIYKHRDKDLTTMFITLRLLA